jgi:ribosomal protein L20
VDLQRRAHSCTLNSINYNINERKERKKELRKKEFY